MELQELYSLMDRFAACRADGSGVEREGERGGPAAGGDRVPASGAAPAAAPVSGSGRGAGRGVSAPLVGVFYAAPPEEPPYSNRRKPQVRKGTPSSQLRP